MSYQDSVDTRGEAFGFFEGAVHDDDAPENMAKYASYGDLQSEVERSGFEAAHARERGTQHYFVRLQAAKRLARIGILPQTYI